MPAATLRTVATVRSPARPSLTARAAASARSSAPIAIRASATNARPAGVGLTPVPARSRSGPPSRRSSARTCCERVGWETWSRAAARVNEPSSATATT